MAVRTVLKQPEKNSQRDAGEKGWACYYSGKEGHLKRDCPQGSKLPSSPVCKAPHWRVVCPRGVCFRAQTLKTIRTEGALGSPHKVSS